MKNISNNHGTIRLTEKQRKEIHTENCQMNNPIVKAKFGKTKYKIRSFVKQIGFGKIKFKTIIERYTIINEIHNKKSKKWNTYANTDK